MWKKIKISLVLLVCLTFNNIYGQYNFQADVVEGCDSLIGIRFWLETPAVSDSIILISWDFEGGDPPYDLTANKDDTIVVDYNSPDSYRVFVNITFDYSDTTIDKTGYINVHQTLPAIFSYSDTLEIAPYSYVFMHTVEPSGSPETYYYNWDFDDGTTDTGKVVVHTFPGADTYNVNLTVSESYGCSDTQSAFVLVEEPPPPYLITASETEGCDILSVKFDFINNAPVDTIASIYWDFGNGETSTSFDPDTVTYTQGTYSLNYNLNGGDDNILMDTIKVHATANASFVYSDTSQIADYSIVFRQNSQLFDNTATYGFDWDFDDGTADTGRIVVHTFPGAATYDVSLIVSDNFECSDSYTSSVTVTEPAQIYITADQTEGCDSLKVKFGLTNLDTDTVTSVSWDFGNGTTSNEIEPDTVFYENTTSPRRAFDVTIIINGDTADAKLHNDFITVYRTVTTDFRCADTLTTDQSLIKVCWNIDHLYDESSSYDFLWNFEGIGDVTGRRPLLSFPAVDDTITASLIITDLTHGCSDTTVREIILATILEIQNFFTPNDDDIFDDFVIEGGSMPLYIQIYSRSGTLVYEAKGSKTIRWDGTTESGQKLQPGVYFYILRALEADPGGRYTKKGFIHLFR
jgi:gliding motility-associated-like protein